MIWFILGPDRNSGPVPVPVEFGWYRFRSGTDRFGRYQTGTDFFFMLYLGFMMSYLHHVPLQFSGWITCTPPVPRLYHVLPSSFQTASRALLQFPDCITCYPRVHKMYHAPAPPPPFGDTWRGILSLFSPFVTFIDFTLSTDISA